MVMTVRTTRIIANILLTAALVLLAITVLGMSGVMPKLWQSREMIWVCFVLLVGARLFRRRAAALNNSASAGISSQP
jgi:hypothetical protein